MDVIREYCRHICVVIVLLGLSSQTHAQSCREVFVSPITGLHSDSRVAFEYNAQLFGSGGHVASAIAKDDTLNNQLSCETQQCVDSGQRSALPSLPEFNTQSSSNTQTAQNNQSLRLAQGSYDRVQLNYRAHVHFEQNNQTTFINTLNATGSQTQLTFDSGVYWINDFSLGFETQINVNGDGQVLLFINTAHLNESTVKFNATGTPEQLVLVFYTDTTLGYRAVVNGFIVANEGLTVGNESVITGGIAGHDVLLNFESEVHLNDTSVNALEFASYCNAQGPDMPEPVLDFRFDRTYWTDASDDVLDSSANAVHGSTIADTQVYSQGLVCRAASFDGRSDYIDAPGIDAYLRNSATVSYWVKTQQVGNNTMWQAPGVLGNENAGDGNDIFWGYIDASGYIGFQKGNGAAVKSNAPINTNQWTHVAFTWDEHTGQAHAYINGELTQSAMTESGQVTSTFSSIGRLPGSRSPENFAGQLDELLVFDEILDATQIAHIYKQQTDGNNIDGSARNCPVEAQAGRTQIKNTVIQPEFTQVCFARPFSEVPKVMTMINSDVNGYNAGLRIKNVTTTGFEVAQVRSPENSIPEAEQPLGFPSQTIDYIAVVEGDYQLDNDVKVRVGSVDLVNTIGSQSGTGGYRNVISIADMGLKNSPAILAHIQTMNNETNPFPESEPLLATAINHTTETQFYVELDRAQTLTGTVVNPENVGFMVMSPDASGRLNRDLTFASFRTSRRFAGNNTCAIHEFNQDDAATTPIVLANMNTRAGGDGGWFGRCALSPGKVGFHVIEDRDLDPESGHVTESAGGIILNGNLHTNRCDTIISEVHHFRIEHDGNGLTCDEETVTIKACADASCSSLSSQPVTLDLTVNNNAVSRATITGQGQVSFAHTRAESINLGIANATSDAMAPVVCDSSAGASCQMQFQDAGLLFTYGSAGQNIPAQTAGLPLASPLTIQAVENDDGVCRGLLQGPQSITLSQENVDPGGTAGLAFQVAGANIAKHTDAASGTNIDVVFDADSKAILPSPVYNDAGKIRLHARYQYSQSSEAGVVQLTGSSAAFWVAPATLKVAATQHGQDLNGDSANATTTYPAGEPFALTITAYNGAVPAAVTTQYQPVQPQLSVVRRLPNNNGSVAGQLMLSDSESLQAPLSPLFQEVDLPAFEAGQVTLNRVHYSEVGVIGVTAKDANYGNQGIEVTGVEQVIGRFTPAYFKQEVVNNGNLVATCGTNVGFTAYSGQMSETDPTQGAINYSIAPILQITAFNANDQVTQNYHQDSPNSSNDFMKLTPSSLRFIAPTHDLAATGKDGQPLPISAAVETGTLSQSNLNDPDAGLLPKGVLHYQFSNSDHYHYVRSPNAKVAPFNAQLLFSLDDSADTDNVKIEYTSPLTLSGVDIQYGRIVIANTFGPETQDLPLSLYLEHFDGTQFIQSHTDSCSNYDVASVSLNTLTLDASLINLIGATNAFVDGESNGLLLEAPGENNVGTIMIEYNSYDWLKYDWDADGSDNNNPTGTATFGQFQGNPRMINWREN